MLTTAFLIAGVFSFLVAAGVAVWRLVIQNREFGEMPAWEPVLGIINAILAMVFFSLGILRALQGPTSASPEPTPLAEATVAPTLPSGPTVIIVPFYPTPGPTPQATSAAPPATSPTPVAPAVQVSMPAEEAVVSTVARVEGTSQGVASGQVPDSDMPWLYLLVRRTDVGNTPLWWVQSYPVVDPDGSWSGFLDQGLVDIAPGTLFDICAIVTDDLLPIGERAGTPRAFSRDCVSVEAA